MQPPSRVLWKVAYDKKRNESISIVTANNPWITDLSTYVFCESICDQLEWVKWNIANVSKGFTYCCPVFELAKTIPYLPDLRNTELLR